MKSTNRVIIIDKKICALYCTFMIVFLLTSCSSNWTKSLGSYQKDPQITQKFRSYEYIPDYNYFYTGYVEDPDGIVGIQKDYDLIRAAGWGNVTNWQSFEPSDGDKLEDLVNRMGKGSSRYGAYIKAPGGERIGVMYAKNWGIRYTPYIRLLDNNRLEVVPNKYNSTWAPP